MISRTRLCVCVCVCYTAGVTGERADHLCGVSLSVNKMLSAFLAGFSPVKVKLSSAVLVYIRTSFQSYIIDHT